MKKIIFIIFILLISNDIYSQEDKTIELTTSASGKTKEEAIHNSLKSAIEQAFGVFISSKTEILNDGLLTDQIISLSNGNIQQYEIISEIQIKNNSEYAVTTKSKVSISKLTSFIESKGIEVEFKGSIFAMNIKIQQLNEESEVNAIKEMSIVLKNISDRSFDFSIEPEVEPTLNQNNTQKWDIPLLIKVKLNSNFENYKNYFIKTLKAISLNKVEAKNYIDLKKPIYTVMLRNSNRVIDTIVSKNNIEDYLNKLLLNSNNQILYYNLKEKNNVNLNDLKNNINTQKINESASALNISYKKYIKRMFYNLKEGVFGENIGVTVVNDDSLYDNIVLRNNKSSVLLQDLMLYFAHSMQNFIIDDGISKRKYQNLLPERTDYTNNNEFAIENCCEAFYPVILDERQSDSYNYGILTGHDNIKLNLNLLSCIKNEENRYYKNPSIFKINDYNGQPNRSAGRKNIFIANVTSTKFCRNCSGKSIIPNTKLRSVPFEYFPCLEKELNNTLISNSSFNMVIQFNKLDDDSGISAIYKFVDRRTIEDINKIKSYKIYSNN
jgi:hypothetical protein